MCNAVDVTGDKSCHLTISNTFLSISVPVTSPHPQFTPMLSLPVFPRLRSVEHLTGTFDVPPVMRSSCQTSSSPPPDAAVTAIHSLS